MNELDGEGDELDPVLLSLERRNPQVPSLQERRTSMLYSLGLGSFIMSHAFSAKCTGDGGNQCVDNRVCVDDCVCVDDRVCR